MGKLAPVNWAAVDTLANQGLRHLGLVGEPTLVVGLAESSLVLAWRLAVALGSAADVMFTTREHRSLGACRRFKEPHSHAPFHVIGIDKARRYEHVVIMEDEVTTGTTLANLIEAISDTSDRFTVLALKDFRATADKESWKRAFQGTGLEVRLVELPSREIDLAAVTAEPTPEGGPLFNPFGRSRERFRDAFDELSAAWTRHKPATIYAVGECLDVPLAFLGTLARKDRPRLRHVTRSPWIVDGSAIHTRLDFSGAPQTAPHYVYNWVKPDPPRAAVVCESANSAVGDRVAAFLKSSGCQVFQVEVATGD